MRVALVTMPFASHRRPSLQLGLLSAIARRRGFEVDTFHFNLDLAARVGCELYDGICEYRGTALGEWIFSAAAFGPDAPDPEGRLLDLLPDELRVSLEKQCGAAGVGSLQALREEVAVAFVTDLLDQAEWQRYGVVGLTSTFQQNVPSLAFASVLKARFPNVLTLFGGANFDDEMGVELVHSFECIDYAIRGEADSAFPQLLEVLRDGGEPASVPGLIHRTGGETVAVPPEPPQGQLDSLPLPEYDEYFARAERLGLIRVAARRDIDLPFESARGCWWGQRRHCVFCGLNGQAMAFRSKSPQRVLLELATLSLRYRSFRFEAVDNILDPSYFEMLFPLLADLGVTYDVFYEVKANLTRDQLAVLRRAGVRRIQPGIESLNSHVLRLMRKGTTASDNVNLLRWAAHLGISVSWNLLWGFPGEKQEDYDQQAALIPWLVHLQPPVGASRIWLERFSPLFTDRDTFPAVFVHPEASLEHVYPSWVDRQRVAYFFDYELSDILPPDAYASTARAVAMWKTVAADETHRPALTYYYSPGLLQIDDQRDPDTSGTYTFHEPYATLYKACSARPLTARQIGWSGQVAIAGDELERALEDFCRLGLMMRDQHRFLALALPAAASM